MTKGRCDSPKWSPDVRDRNGSELEGLGFNLCVALPRIVVSLISEDRDRVGGQRSEIGDDFVVRQKSDKDDKEEVPSRGARRGLKETMLREDYVEDKSRFELRKHTGVVLLI